MRHAVQEARVCARFIRAPDSSGALAVEARARTVKRHEALRDGARVPQVGRGEHDARLEHAALQLVLRDAQEGERLAPLERLVGRSAHRARPRLVRLAAPFTTRVPYMKCSLNTHALESLSVVLAQWEQRELHARVRLLLRLAVSHTWHAHAQHLNRERLVAISVHRLELCTGPAYYYLRDCSYISL